MAGQSPGTTFIVHLDGIDIPDKDRAQLERSIRGAALTEIARLDFGEGMGVRIPKREWLGLWLERMGGRALPTVKIMLGGRE